MVNERLHGDDNSPTASIYYFVYLQVPRCTQTLAVSLSRPCCHYLTNANLRALPWYSDESGRCPPRRFEQITNPHLISVMHYHDILLLDTSSGPDSHPSGAVLLRIIIRGRLPHQSRHLVAGRCAFM